MVPSRNLTVWAVPFEATAAAASRANAPDDATNEHSAPQSPLNSRRFSALFTTPSFPLLTMLGLRVVLPNRFRRLAAHIACWSFGRRCPLWVKSGHRSTSNQCPLYPQEQTLMDGIGSPLRINLIQPWPDARRSTAAASADELPRQATIWSGRISARSAR